MGLLLISSMMLLGGIYLIFALVWWILQIIANWNIFTKAGEAGWKSLIPIYGDYVSYKIAWQTSYFWLSFILGIVASYVSSANLNESIFLTVIATLLRIVIAVINIMYCIKLSRAFGHGIGFAIGLILLQPIFLLILGFSSDQYYGADR
ncbi:MAG: DUF5684 domain-containing protein [Blautia sp.]|uniref:DUF5684 domain-containing protein n=1 Tax=Blautia sp. TaxID=1955243 RepID=UPI002589AA65|nr:DUF5684 domain-containing protein [Blautia sp.]MCI7290318.1 DUF5684 domain-containing protein [Blautia sp.]